MREPPPQPSTGKLPAPSAAPVARATIFVMDADEEASPGYLWAMAWFKRWGDRVRVVHYSTGGFEHMWDVEAPADAIAEIPEQHSAMSQWSQQPYPPVRERKDRRHGRR